MAKDRTVAFKQSTLLPNIEIRIADKSSACYDAHSHDEFSFGVIQQGAAHYRNLGSQHQIGRGDIVTIKPSDIHSCNPVTVSWSYNMLFVDTHWMGNIQQQITGDRQYDYCAFLHDYEKGGEVRNSFQKLYTSLVNGHSYLEAETHSYDFIEECLRQSNTNTLRTTSVLPHLQRVKEKLFDNVEYNLRLSEVAEEVGVSQYHLIRSFKQFYGLSPHAYLLDERIKRAKSMLKTG